MEQIYASEKEHQLSLIIKERVFETADEGLHNARITRVEDLGVVDTNYGAKDRIRIVLEMLDQKDKEGQPVEVWMSANKVLGAKSTLGKFLASLKIAADGQFDANTLVGRKFQVVIVHNQKDGKTFANVASVIASRAAGQAAPTKPVVQEISDEDIPF